MENKSEQKTFIISKWGKKAKDGNMLKQVVIKTPSGKNSKGRQVFTSRTRHISV